MLELFSHFFKSTSFETFEAPLISLNLALMWTNSALTVLDLLSPPFSVKTFKNVDAHKFPQNIWIALELAPPPFMEKAQKKAIFFGGSSPI